MNATETNPGVGEMRERMLDFAAYVLTSARALYREPQSYGPMRLADTLEKGLELLQAAGIRDETVEQAMSAVRESRPVAMTDPEGFAKALDRAIAVLVQATLEGKPEA
ncbi:DUF6092 family protein [Paenibacillus favisporus]|uniref:DUF6092 family protein n=1 Tax=Paenibacillus favisporus TaxID=221028 RepID=UPI001F10EFEF|nr:DUF6092 family protein [Paenibacillus favisporus]